MLARGDVGPEFFERLRPDAGDFPQFVDDSVEAAFDNAVDHDFVDAGEGHEFVAGGGVQIERLARRGSFVAGREARFGVFVALELALVVMEA